MGTVLRHLCALDRPQVRGDTQPTTWYLTAHVRCRVRMPAGIFIRTPGVRSHRQCLPAHYVEYQNVDDRRPHNFAQREPELQGGRSWTGHIVQMMIDRNADLAYHMHVARAGRYPQKSCAQSLEGIRTAPSSNQAFCMSAHHGRSEEHG